jgi:hypothetical protein
MKGVEEFLPKCVHFHVANSRSAPDHMKVDTYGKPYLHTFYALISD